MIDVEKAKALPEGWWFLTLNGQPVVACACQSVCVRYARILSEARAADYRDAMRMLTADIGLCDAAAGELYLHLQGAPQSRRAMN